MQFPSMDDEEGDFSLTAAARSRLSSLFENESSGGDINQALTFTAPKQPKKTDNVQGSAGSLKLIHAVVVHSYKLKDGNYTNQGKLGCAILGHHETSSYKLLLYKGKQLQVTYCTIVPSFTFHVQPNNYANFYDDKKENWSLNFDSEAALIEFAKQVALAKANSQSKTASSLIIQDLASGDGAALEQGDAAEVKYTGWLFSNYTFGQVFDSNMNSDSSFRIRIGKSRTIKGWHEGLLGSQKGTKRLLIIPPSLGYGSEGIGNAVPPNSTLIFEVHVLKVKISREASHSPSPVRIADNVCDKKPDVPPRHSFSQEDNIRMRGASISEQLSQSPKKDKAHLISRMAKMGTATLPLQGAVPVTVGSDSENEEEVSHESAATAQSTISKAPPAKDVQKIRETVASSTMTQLVQSHSIQASVPFHLSQQSDQTSLYAQSAVPIQPPYPSAASFPPYSTTSQFPMPQVQYPLQNLTGMVPSISTGILDTHLPLLINETRNQNSEVRLNLCKIADKVDTVIQKVDDLRMQGKAGTGSMPFMESTVLVQNIERIVQENQRLKDDVEAKNSKIQSLNEKICDLFQRNQRFFEESSNMLEQRNDTLQATSSHLHAKLTSLEQEKTKHLAELSDVTGRLTAVETELSRHQKETNELNEKLLEMENHAEKQQKVINDAQEKLRENEAVISTLRENLQKVIDEKDLLTKMLQDEKRKCEELQNEKDSLKRLLDENEQKFLQMQLKAKDEVMKVQTSYEDTLANKLENEVKRLKKELEESLKENNDLKSKLQSNLSLCEKSEASYKETIKKLQIENENALSWKRKYEVFHDKTKLLKEKYEKQIMELVTEIKHLQAVKSGTTSEFSAEIKKVMNILYKLLQGKFDSNTSYLGSKVLELVLQTIRGLTLQMLEMKRRSSTDSSQTSEIGNLSKLSEPDVKINMLEKPNETAENLQNSNMSADLPNAEDLENNAVSNDGQQNGMKKEIVTSDIDKSVIKTSDLAVSGVEKSALKENGEISDTKSDEENTLLIAENMKEKQTDMPDSFDVSVPNNSDEPQSLDTRKDVKCVSPDHPLTISVPMHVCRSLARNTFFAILFAYVVFWIGALVHDVEATSPFV